MRERIVGCCGIVCSECPVYKATQRDSNKVRTEILERQREKWAEVFSKQHGREFRLEDINCNGCTSDSERVFWFCRDCRIRRCAREKGLVNCAFCPDYACDRLMHLFEKSRAPARETLEEIRQKFGPSDPQP